MSNITQVAQQDERKDKKMFFGIAFLILAIVMIIGAGFAFFSDVITGDGEATAGTLDISGNITLHQNGGAAVTDNEVTNLNPGDVLTFGGTITNNGSKSAWIRQIVQFTEVSSTDNTGGKCSVATYTNKADCEDNSGTWTAGATQTEGNLLDYVWVCTGNVTQTALLAASTAGTLGTGTTATCSAIAAADVNANLATAKIFGDKATYANPTDVIKGTVEGTSDGTEGSGITWTPPATDALTIYFDSAAPNAAQNGNMSFTASVQALQYRNNNTTSPAVGQWATVTKTEFAI